MAPIEIPRFEPDVPEPLLRSLSPEQRWIYEQSSIQSQQNRWMIEQMCAGDERFGKIEAKHSADDTDLREKQKASAKEIREIRDRLDGYDRIRDKMTAKGSVIFYILSALVGPVILAFLGAYFLRWLERVWK